MSRARRDDLDVIELVDADPTVFGGAPIAAGEIEPSTRVPRPQRPAAPAWMVGLVVVAMVTVAGTAAWRLRPWYFDPVVIVRDRAAETASTNHFVIGATAGAPVDALIPSAQPAAPLAIESGAVFIDESANAGDQRPASAIFYRVDQGASDDPSPEPGATISSVVVHGAPARVSTSGSASVVRWQDATGKVEVLRTDGVDPKAALRLANALTSDGPTVRISRRSALGQLRPIGTVVGTQRLATLFSASQAFGHDTSLSLYAAYHAGLAVSYEHAGLAVGPSLGSDTMALIRSSFPVRTNTTVHGYEAIAVEISTTLASGDATLTTVMWTEGGHLIAVTATSHSLALQYAEAVRPATDAEWQQLIAVSRASSATAG